jgi:hypothetical protein
VSRISASRVRSIARPAKNHGPPARKPWRRGLAELLVFGNEAADDRQQFDDCGARVAVAIRDYVVDGLVGRRGVFGGAGHCGSVADQLEQDKNNDPLTRRREPDRAEGGSGHGGRLRRPIRIAR